MIRACDHFIFMITSVSGIHRSHWPTVRSEDFWLASDLKYCKITKNIISAFLETGNEFSLTIRWCNIKFDPILKSPRSTSFGDLQTIATRWRSQFYLMTKLKFQVQPFSKLEVFDMPKCIQLIHVIVDTRKSPIAKYCQNWHESSIITHKIWVIFRISINRRHL